MAFANDGTPPDLPPGVRRIAQALRGFTNESEIYVAAVGREAGMHRTDLTGLSVVMDRGDQGGTTTPGQLSATMHLSAPATSAMLDRLERLDHVRRVPHPTDRRSVTVEMTEHARAVGTAMFTPLRDHLAPVYARRSAAELDLIATFLEEVVDATREARLEVAGHDPDRTSAGREDPRR